MNDRHAVDPLLNEVRALDVQAYLQTQGWIALPDRGLGLDLFAGPNDDAGNPIVQLVPRSESVPGFSLRIWEILNALSIIEQRSASQILRDIVTQSTNPSRPAGALPRPWYTFDQTVLPMVFEEIESRKPAARRPWDQATLTQALNDSQNPRSAAFAYNSVPWPLSSILDPFIRTTLIVTAIRASIVLAGFFNSDELLAAVATRILSMWKLKCPAFSAEQTRELAAASAEGDEEELYDLFVSHISTDGAVTEGPIAQATEQDAPSVGEGRN